MSNNCVLQFPELSFPGPREPNTFTAQFFQVQFYRLSSEHFIHWRVKKAWVNSGDVLNFSIAWFVPLEEERTIIYSGRVL